MHHRTDEVSEVAAGLRALLETCNGGVGEGLLTVYLDQEQPTFTGAYFATFGSNPVNRFTADDLASLSLLDVPAPRELVLQVGLTASDEFNDLLSQVPADVTLWDAEQPAIEALDRLWYRLVWDVHQVGAVRANKLLARKRPELNPVTDRVIDRWFFQRGFRDALRGALLDEPLRAQLDETLTAELAGGLSLLRRIDIAVWLLGANNRHAKQVRSRLGVRPPRDRVRW